MEEAFLYRLGRMVQALGDTPLFLMDRGLDRVSRMKRLQEWGIGFLIRLRQNRQVATEAGKVFLLEERHPQGPMQRQGVRLFGPRGLTGGVMLHRARGSRSPGVMGA